MAKKKNIGNEKDNIFEKNAQDISFITLYKQGEAEFTEKKSVFISYASPVKTSEEAVAFIEKVRAKYPDARHTVYAYLISNENATRYSDDGEPQGTGGIPVLDVLRKKGITDAVVTVTRYFGGILLGAPGLVRAYTTSAVTAVENAGIAKYSPFTSFAVNCGYSEYQKIKSELLKIGATENKIEYGNGVESVWSIPEKLYSRAEEKIIEISAGGIKAENLGTVFGISEIV